MALPDEQDELRAWLSRHRTECDRYVALASAAREAEQRLKNSDQGERADAIEAFVRACVARDLGAPSIAEFDEQRWERAIALGLIDRKSAVEVVEALCGHRASEWLDTQSRALRPPPLDRDAGWHLSDRALLEQLPALRDAYGTRAADWIDRWIREAASGEPLAIHRWAVAWLRGAREELFANDDALFEWSDSWLTGPDGEDGPFVDRRALLAERWLEIDEVERALRWFERIALVPANDSIGPSVVTHGAPKRLGRALGRVLARERSASIEHFVFEALRSRRASTFEWLDFAAWASDTMADRARECAVNTFEENGGYIDAARLGAEHQRRVANAMAERFGEWVDAIDVFERDSLVGSPRDSLCVYIESLPLADATAASIVWPLVARVAARAKWTPVFVYRASIARAVEACAKHGIEGAVALRDAWMTSEASGWRPWLATTHDGVFSESLLVVLLAVPFAQRKALVRRLDEAGVCEVSAHIRTHGATIDRAFVDWLLAQRSDLLSAWMRSATPSIAADDWWRLLDAWADAGLVVDEFGPCGEDGRDSEFARWVSQERSWMRSRWSWTRDETLQWIASEGPFRERHWLFEPGVSALVQRLRGDAIGCAALARLFDALIVRVADVGVVLLRERIAIDRLLPFATTDALRRFAEVVARFEGRTFDWLDGATTFDERLDVISRVAIARRLPSESASTPTTNPTLEERFEPWKERATSAHIVPRSWMLEALPTERSIALAEWAVSEACAASLRKQG
ncbi:MAG: hypothetical protein JNK05_19670 [Myxococcales bacterium]|nr:hypothetical protein [Myxococcales bacterium]